MDEVRAYVEMNRPDLIINCAGICGIAFCEENSDLAYKVNAIGARNFSVAARSAVSYTHLDVSKRQPR